MTSISPTATPLAPTPIAVDPGSLRNQFVGLAVDMSRIDAKLEQSQASGLRPTTGWDTTFENFASRLDSARMGFAALRPDAGDMVARLGQDLFTVSKHSGTLGQMQQHGLAFSSGWDTLLDRSIADVQRAGAMLDNAAPPVPPVQPPHPPTTPSKPGVPAFHGDVSKAVDLVNQSISQIRTVPESDRGDESTKQARIGAYKVNLAAQALLEPYFTSPDQALVSTLRRADASLEDANWQLAKKPSPDGRFNGVDIPGALRDSQTAVELLNGLLSTVPA